MAESTWWWLLAGALVGAELLTGTFYLLMLALGAAAGAIAAHLGLPLTGQIVSAAVLGAAPLAIFIENRGTFSGGRAKIAAAPPKLLEDNLFTYSLELIGLGGVVMNMWIAALSMGARAAFMGDICVAEAIIAKELGLRCDLAGVLLIGYPAEPSGDGRKPTPPQSEHVVWHRGER